MNSITASLLAYTIAAALITLTPGLDTMLVLRTAIVEGPRRAWGAGAGIVMGCLVWGASVAIGVGALMEASQTLYRVLQLAGAAYLLYLGISILRAPPRDLTLSASGGASPGSSWFLRGLWTNLLNPKVGLFYVTFLPPFIPSGVNVFGYTLLLAAIHALLGIAWFALLIGAARSMTGMLSRRGVVSWLDRLTGGVLILLGLKIAFSRP